jgi:hypothetical protein
MSEVTNELLIASIKRAIDAEVGLIVESEMEDMVEKVKKRVRERVGAISGNVFSAYSMHRNGHDIMITVKFKDDDKL